MVIMKGDTVGGTEEKTKRKISVGFIQPEVLMGDTIYVQLTQYSEAWNMAIAVSRVKFNYVKGGSVRISSGTRIDNKYYRKDEEFIEMLRRNNGVEVVEDRYKTDGLALTSRCMKEADVSRDAGKRLSRGLTTF